MEAGYVLRGLRAIAFAVVCVLLTAVGHVLTSGAVLPWRVLLLAAAGAAGGAWCFAGRERGPLAVAALTVGTQATLHSVFALGQAIDHSGHSKLSWATLWWESLRCGGGVPLHEVRSSRGLSAGLVDGPAGQAVVEAAGHLGGLPMAGRMADMGHVAHAGAPGGAGPMLAAHLLIATLSVWWMWGGERAVFRLVRTVSLALVPRLRLVLQPVLPTLPPEEREAARAPHSALPRLLLVHVVSRRGPPLEPAVP
ncbi:PE-PGRS family protein [Streptomyces sp. NPDC058773]|uniref:PE-PGRS family protein n=1 Tax=Streptomyces sp. NPDC058773 TaxID=3346632 RepID=UPI0036AD2B30